MGIRYDGLKLRWLNQIGGTTVTINWLSPSSDLGSFYGNETLSIPLKTFVVNGLPATYSLQSGILPGGVTISGNTLAGRLYNTAGNYNFTIRATSGAAYADQTFTANVNVVQAPIWITNAGSLGSGYETTNATITFDAIDPQGLPLTYSLIAGAFPASLVLNSATGVLSGALSPVGGDTMFSFTVAANNSLLANSLGFNYTVKANEPPEWITNGVGQDQTYYILGTVYEGSNVSYPIEAINFQNDETLTYSLISGVLPTGLIVDSANAVITGTLPILTTNTIYKFALNASDGVKSSQRNFEIDVLHNYPPVWNSVGILASALGGTYIDVTVSASDVNNNPITYSLDANSSLPGTITFDAANATLFGDLPFANSSTQTYYFNLIANNGVLSTTRKFGVTAQQYRAIIWNTPAGSIGNAVEGDYFTYTLSATGGIGAVTYSVDNAAALPTGFTVNSVSGDFSGIFQSIVTATTYTFNVIANDGILPSSRTFSVTEEINLPPVWVTNSGLLFEDVSGYNESYTVLASSPLGRVVSYSISNGALPFGLSLSQDGEITGKMELSANTNTYDFTITASNGSLSSSQSFYIISEQNLPPVWNTNSGLIGNFVEQSPISFTFDATDPEGYEVTYKVADVNSLPSGVTLNANGVLSGKTPAELANATFNFTVQASDGAQLANSNFTMVVLNDTPPIWQTISPLANAVEGVFYTLQFVAAGATSFNVNSGTIANGLSFYSNGVLSGIPTDTTDTEYSFTLSANNGIRSDTRNFSLTVRENEPPVWISSGQIANALGGNLINVQVSALDRNGLTLYYTNASSLPAGLSISNSGSITGILPIVENGATYSFTLSANNGTYASTQDFSIVVKPNEPPTWEKAIGFGAGVPLANGSSLGTAVESTHFSVSLLTTDPEYLFVTASNTTPLPGTLTITVPSGTNTDSGGNIIRGTNTVVISGILPAVSTDTIFPFTLAAYDGYQTTTQQFTIEVQHHYPPVWITNSGSLGNTYSGESFNYALVASSVNGFPLTYTLNASTLPGSLGLSSAGIISGNLPINVANTTYTFTVTVSDGTYSANQTFSILNMPNLPPVWVTSNSAPLVTQYETTSFSTTLLATDPENRGISYVLGTNNFPNDTNGNPIAGINSNSGILSGTFPNVLFDTTYTFTIEAFDYERVNQTNRIFTVVNKFDQIPVWVTRSGLLGQGTEGTTFSYTLVANAGSDTVSYTISNGALPSGLTLNSNSGLISGTLPTVVADTTYTFTVTASDTVESSSQSFSIKTLLQRPPVWTTPAGVIFSGNQGSTINTAVVANSPNNLTLTYTDVSDNFPSSISFNPNTQVISGILPSSITNTTTYSIEVSASDGSIAVERTFEIVNVYQPAPIWITNSALGSFAYSASVDIDVVANSLIGLPLTYSLTSGSLPSGLSFFANGAILGTINSAVNNDTAFNFTVTVSDGTNNVPQAFTMIEPTYVDPYHSNTISLLHLDNNTLDSGNSALTWSLGSGASYSNAVNIFGLGSSVLLNGTLNGYVVSSPIGSNSKYALGTQNFTMEIWANCTSLPLYTGYGAGYGSYAGTLISYGSLETNNDDNGLSMAIEGTSSSAITGINIIGYNSGGTETLVYDPVISTLSGQTVAFNQWNHYCLQRTGNLFQVFVNGKLIGQTYNSSAIYSNSGFSFRLGLIDISAYANPFNGYIDEYRLTVGQTRYTGDFTPARVEFSSIQSNNPFWPPSTGIGPSALIGGALQNSPVSNIVLAAQSLTGNALVYSLSPTSEPLPGTMAITPNGVLYGKAPALLNSANNYTATFTIRATDANNSLLYTDQNVTYNIFGAGDPYWSNTSILLHFEDFANGTVITDSTGKNSLTSPANLLTQRVTNENKMFGNSCLVVDGTVQTTYIVQTNANPVGMSFGTNDFTIETWIYIKAMSTTNTSGQYRTVICALQNPSGAGSTSNLAWTFYVLGNSPTNITTILFECDSISKGAQSSISMTTNAWHHVAVTRVSGVITFFIDGVSYSSITETGNNAIGNSALGEATSAALQIGGLSINGYSGNLNGYIDEFRITNGVGRYTTNFNVQTMAFPDVQDGQLIFPSETIGFVSNSNVNLNITAQDPYNQPITYTLLGGNLPSGLSFSANGSISGFLNTQSNSTTSNITVQATNTDNFSSIQTFSIGVGAYNDPYISNVVLLMPMTGNVTTTPNVVVGTANAISIYSSGALISSNYSKWGQNSAEFVGSGFLYASPRTTLSGDFTIEMWVYPTALGATQSILFSGYGNTAAGDFIFSISSNGALLWVGGAGEGVTTITGNSGQIFLNTWSHVAVTRQSGSMRLFYNGTQSGPVYTSATNFGIDVSKWGIGGYQGTPSSYMYTGYMNDVRVTNGIARYTSSFTPPQAPLPSH
jgi:hypothetical protein